MVFTGGKDRTATAALVLLAVVVAGIAGGVSAAVVMIVSAVALGAAAIRLAAPEDRRFVTIAVLAGLSLRATAAVGLHLVLVANGTGGALFQDDAGYVQLGERLARLMAGEEEFVAVDPSLANAYVTFIAVAFRIFGPSILALKLLNVLLGVLSALLVHRTVAVLAGARSARWALILMMVFPSLVLWSSLALKDTFALTLAVVAIWALTEFIASTRWPWLLVTFVAVLPLQSVRVYLYALLVAMIPVALLVALWRHGRPTALRWSVLTLAVGVTLLVVTGSSNVLSTSTIIGSEGVRRGMAVAARTAFVESSSVTTAEPGSVFVITVVGTTPEPVEERRTIVVAPGTTLVLATPAAAATVAPAPTSSAPEPPSHVRTLTPVRPGATASVVTVRPGDIVVVASAAQQVPASSLEPQPLQLSLVRPTLIATEESQSDEARFTRSLLHVPKGVTYLLFAPFPWEMRSLTDVATLPDLVMWYFTLGLGIVGLREAARRRRWDLAYVVLVGAGLLFGLALAEGNIGTLIRHRAMLLPPTVIVASLGAPMLHPWAVRGARAVARVTRARSGRSGS